MLVYGGVAAGVAALALLGWLLWSRPQAAPPDRHPSRPDAHRFGSRRRAVTTDRAGHDTNGSATPPPSRFADHEADLPRTEVRKLRGVAAWSGEKLPLTVENPTALRVTELRVRVSRFDGDARFRTPLRLPFSLPPGRSRLA